jgi:regulator of replication initiation timing
MDKDLWKHCLDVFPDEVVVELLHKSKIRVPGFNTKMTLQKYRTARPLIIGTMIANRSSLTRAADEWVRDENWNDYRSHSLNELFDAIVKDDNSFVAIMLALVSSKEPTHTISARLLYDKLEENGWLEQYASVRKKSAETQNGAQTGVEQRDDKTQIKKLQKEIDALTKQLSEAHKQIHKLTYENKKLQQEISDIKKEMSASKRSHEQERKQWNEERDLLMERLRNFEETAITNDHGEERKSMNSDSSTVVRQTPYIALIGRDTKPNREITRTLWYRIELCDAQNFSVDLDFLEKLKAFDEIWILKRDMNFSQRRKVERSVLADRVRVFDNHSDIQNFISKSK